MDTTRDNTIPAEATTGHHESDGTMGEVAGTGAGAISGGVVGAAIGGPIGAVVGAVAGGVLGAAGGEAAHKVGDDHDDVNLDTGSEGSLGRDTGAGAGAISGAAVGAVAGGPVGAVAGAVGGGVLGAAAGDSAKHFGETDTPTDVTTSTYGTPAYGTTGDYNPNVPVGSNVPDTTIGSTRVGNGLPGVQTGGYTEGGVPDTRGITEKAADAVTGDDIDDKTGRRVI